MKVAFAPYSEKWNTYQRNLRVALEKYGVDVIPTNLGYRLFFRTEAIGSAQIVHFHWYERYTRAGGWFKSLWVALYFYSRLRLLKGRKKYVWTVHNLYSHERRYPSIEKFFLKRFISLMDGFSAHNAFTKVQLIEKFQINPSKIFIIPHANYSNEFRELPVDHSLDDEFPVLKRDLFTVGIVGQIRLYKGVFELLRVFSEMAIPDARLVIAGNIQNDIHRVELEKSAQSVPNVVLIPRYISNSEMRRLLSKVDVLVYPYKDIVTSGALILGMGFGKICACSNVGSMAEFVDKEYVFANDAELKEILKKVYKMPKDQRNLLGVKNADKVAPFTWDRMASETKKMYESLLSQEALD